MLQEKVTSATAEATTTSHKAKSFARGLITGEPKHQFVGLFAGG